MKEELTPVPTPVFLPGEFHHRGAWQAAVHGLTNSRTRLTEHRIGLKVVGSEELDLG